MAQKIDPEFLRLLVSQSTNPVQPFDQSVAVRGAVQGQNLSDTITNNKLKQQSDQLSIQKEIQALKDKRDQDKKTAAYAQSLKQGPVVARPGGMPVHAADTIQGLAPEDQTLADIAQPFPKETAQEQLKNVLLDKSEAGKTERAKLKQDQANSAPDKIKQIFQLADGTTVGVTYGGALKPITKEALNPVIKTLPAEQVEKTGTFQAMTDLVGRIRKDITDEKTGQLSEQGKEYLGPMDTTSQVAKSFTPAADVGFTNFHQKLADLKNQIIYLRSGKQINEQEYKRLRDSLPSEYRDESTFLSNLDNFENTFKDVMAKRQEAFKEAGYKTPTVGGAQPSPAAGKPDIGAALRAVLPKRK